jgi:hypothetical protein
VTAVVVSGDRCGSLQLKGEERGETGLKREDEDDRS